jgi:hypothetical protein
MVVLIFFTINNIFGREGNINAFLNWSITLLRLFGAGFINIYKVLRRRNP